MASVSGTPRKLLLNGFPLRIMGDSDITIQISDSITEAIPTSGAPIFKKIKRVEEMQNVVVAADIGEQKQLKELAESLESFGMSMTFADNSVYRGKGQINFENFTTADKRGTLTLLPEEPWTLVAQAA